MKNMIFCQSCGMPMTEEQHFGKNQDGSKNEDYCLYCFKEGAFTKDETMEEMIESCIPHCLGGDPWHSEDEARKACWHFFLR